jgi:hypothetical protein
MVVLVWLQKVGVHLRCSLLEGLGGSLTIGETGVYRDTGSKGTVGGKIVDINKIKTNFSMLFQYVYSTLA